MLKNVGGHYGAVMGLVMIASVIALPDPYGFVAWWTFMGAQTLIMAAVVWHRTRMRFTALCELFAAAVFFLWANLIYRTGGFDFDLRSPLLWIAIGGLALSVALLPLDQKLHRDRWLRWARRRSSREPCATSF